MKRLTKKEQLAGHTVNYVGCDDCFDVWSVPKKFMGNAIDRLAAYEDTKLEPEEVADFDRLVKLYLEAGLDKQFVLACIEATKAGMTVDRLRELAQADREGRCVVLPNGGYINKDGENALKSAMHTCFYHNNPVTRFIADAVAEKLVRNETKMKHCEGMSKNG